MRVCGSTEHADTRESAAAARPHSQAGSATCDTRHRDINLAMQLCISHYCNLRLETHLKTFEAASRPSLS